MHSIDRDRDRFKQIIRGRIKKNLRKYMSQDGVTIYDKKGKNKITIPITNISLPKFIFGKRGGGVGQGQDPGDAADGKNKAPARGNEAGQDSADNQLEIDVTLDELTELLGEELELPRIEPKGKEEISLQSQKYCTIRQVGPESLRHRKRTFMNALKRTIASGEYVPEDPVIIPIKEDKRYRASKPITIPHYQAVVFYLMDVSGSMGPKEKELSRLTSFWIDLWLQSHYDCIRSRYIIHNYTAKEVDRHTFFHTAESGGTRIASAYELCRDIIRSDYPIHDWNIYVFQYSDGDDWYSETSAALNIISDFIKAGINQVSYCQVRESGRFRKYLEDRFPYEKRLITTQAYEKEGILDAIKEMFQGGN